MPTEDLQITILGALGELCGESLLLCVTCGRCLKPSLSAFIFVNPRLKGFLHALDAGGADPRLCGRQFVFVYLCALGDLRGESLLLCAICGWISHISVGVWPFL